MNAMFHPNDRNPRLFIAVFRFQTIPNGRHTNVTIVFLDTLHEALVYGMIGECQTPRLLVLQIQFDDDISAGKTKGSLKFSRKELDTNEITCILPEPSA